MSRDQLVTVVAAAGLLGGLAMMWSGAQRRQADVAARAGQRSVELRPLLAGTLAAAATFAISGWVVPAAMIGVLGGLAVARIGGSAGSHDSAEFVEALASWVESLRDVLQAAGQPIGAIGATVETSPPMIRPAVRRLYAELGAGRPAELAVRSFADELDDPLGDLVATGLLISVTRGAQTETVLSALAEQARQQADRRRIVEAERAPMRHQVRMVSLIMCLLLAAVFIFARSSYLAAYNSSTGQLMLVVILAGYAAMLIRVAALSRFPKPSRFLTSSPEER